MAIAAAQDRVVITTPYFVPDEALLEALTTAALRGIDVKLLLPRRSDSRLAIAAGRSYYEELMRAGVRIYEYLAGFLHAKAMAVDGTISIVGSANFDQRSFRLNFEASAICYDPAVARDVESIFEEDLTLSQEVTEEDRKTNPFRTRLGEASARLLGPLL
jgi:cardiolipin synthase